MHYDKYDELYEDEHIFGIEKIKKTKPAKKAVKGKKETVKRGKKNSYVSSAATAYKELKKEVNSPKKIIKAKVQLTKKVNKTKDLFIVEKGRMTGLIATQRELQFAILGFEGAEYKRFTDKNEAKEYLNELTGKRNSHKILFENTKAILMDRGYDNFFYTDGSSIHDQNTYSSGFVLEAKGEYISESVMNFNSLSVEGIAPSTIAEFQGVMLAVLEAKNRNLKKFVIVFDYTGVIFQKTKRNQKCAFSASYYDWMKRETAGLDIEFLKAKSHAGIEGNERVDKLVYNSSKEAKETATA